MKKLKGVVTAMLTPFDEKGEVVENALKDHVDFLIKKKVDCLYPGGTTGEMYLLNTEERKRIAQIVVKQAASKVTVYIHVGAMNERDTINLAKHAYEIGADGIGVVTPSYFKVTDYEMEEYYVSVANSIPEDFPVYLYNIPQLSGNDLTPRVIERILKRTKNVIGIKYSLADMLRTAEYIKLNDGQFSVLQGTDRLLLPSLVMGCDGTVSGVSSVYPEPFVSVYQNYISGDMEAAAESQLQATEIAELLMNGSNMSYFKEGLKLRGIGMGHMRGPLRDIGQDEIKLLKDKLDRYASKGGGKIE